MGNTRGISQLNNNMKTIIEQINDCPNNIVDILELREPVADYITSVIELFSNGLLQAESADKIILDVEIPFRKKIQELRYSLLN